LSGLPSSRRSVSFGRPPSLPTRVERGNVARRLDLDAAIAEDPSGRQIIRGKTADLTVADCYLRLVAA